MRRFRTLPLLLIALFCAWAGLVRPVRAQDTPTESGETAAPIAALKALKNKTLVFVFDVSGSMNAGGNLRRAREAAITILREGAAPGDHVALLTFGPGTRKVFDTTIASRADLSDLVAQVPARIEQGEGTNIRQPHHQALQMVDAGLPNPGVIVLLTDSFNDEPKTTDADYPSYLKYYTPGGQLTKYPRTPENRDYERLLAKLLRSGKLTQFGIGIQIDENGRPIERLPQAAPPRVDAPDTTATTDTPAPAPVKDGPSVPWLWIGLGVLAVAVGGFVLAPTLRATSVRITGGGPGGAKDFHVKNGQTVRLGGDGASASFDAYALPGTKEPVALIKGARGQIFIAPAAGKGNNAAAARVYHNGLLLEAEAPLHFGDEVRVSVPDAAGVAAPKEFRLKFEDPRKSY